MQLFQQQLALHASELLKGWWQLDSEYQECFCSCKKSTPGWRPKLYRRWSWHLYRERLKPVPLMTPSRASSEHSTLPIHSLVIVSTAMFLIVKYRVMMLPIIPAVPSQMACVWLAEDLHDLSLFLRFSQYALTVGRNQWWSCFCVCPPCPLIGTKGGGSSGGSCR